MPAVREQLDRITLFDTTLRDGEQSPGASLGLDEKLEVARALAGLGVDVIEAGFPAASPAERQAVAAIARELAGPTICALARAVESDLVAAGEALAQAPRRRVHVFLATSPVHREHKLGLNPRQVVDRVRRGVARACELAPDVEFSAEDAARTEPDFLAEVVEVAIAEGAGTVNLPDTVGWAVPSEYGALFAHMRRTVRGVEKIVLSAHCHDDLGLALANSLAAVAAGARQVECTVNGIGERAGNCALEELEMALRARPEVHRVRTGIRADRLCPVSRLVEARTGLAVARNKAVVGANAFAHEAGVHQDGMLKHRSTYEVLAPEEVGSAASRLVLGRHSGRSALVQRLSDLGLSCAGGSVDELFIRFKRLADGRKEVHDADLVALVSEWTGDRRSREPRS